MDDYAYYNEQHEFKGKTIEKMYFIDAEGDGSFHIDFTDGTNFEMMYMDLELLSKPESLKERNRWSRE